MHTFAEVWYYVVIYSLRSHRRLRLPFEAQCSGLVPLTTKEKKIKGLNERIKEEYRASWVFISFSLALLVMHRLVIHNDTSTEDRCQLARTMSSSL